MKKGDKHHTKMWFTTFLVNAIVLFAASSLYSSSVVMGNSSISTWAATVVSALLLTVALTQVQPAVEALNVKISGDMNWLLAFGIANAIFVWILSRLAVWTGFGISSLLVTVILGIVLTAVQTIIWKTIVSEVKK